MGVTFSNSEPNFDERGAAHDQKQVEVADPCADGCALHVQNDAYISVVEALAGILEQRDKTFREFKDSGGRSVIEYTNKGGSTNMTKNPLLVLWDDLNKSALAYWRELGMTPSSFKKMTGGTLVEEKESGLVAALKSIESS